jgi:hypothetical protein
MIGQEHDRQEARGLSHLPPSQHATEQRTRGGGIKQWLPAIGHQREKYVPPGTRYRR